VAHAMLATALAQQTQSVGERLDDTQIREIQMHIKRAMELDGNNEMVLPLIVGAYQGIGEFETALRLAKRTIELHPHSPGSLLLLGLAQQYLGQFADAIATYTRPDHVSSFDNARYLVLTHLGECHLLEGRPTEAEDALDRALALHPGFHLALKWKAIVAAARGEEAEALAIIRQLRVAEPGMGIEQHVWQIMYNPHLAERAGEAVATLRRLWDASGG
jgi:tetratricopeptide (TPR) repeat protein